ncbi:MAG TPA: kelch repeat-containing protein [Verrucomicrobiae bacterium]|nr:kelch repeat-containing protein [Verrucomicrobiae bacterium]
MRNIPVALLSLFLAIPLFSADKPKVPPMPEAVSLNAVASLKGGLELYSLMGIGNKKTWNDVTSKVYVLHLTSGKWSEGRAVPGVGGRLGASAVGTKGQIFLFGGYLVDGQGMEITVPDVNAYLPDEHRWYRGEDMPVPVDSAVIGLNHDRYIYLIGGRSKNGPVNNVQVYDLQKNTWSEATPFPGTPVFGHAGGLAEDSIVIVDGAKKNPAPGSPYLPSDECWIGHIDHKDPNQIAWSKLPAHPGPGRFGIVAGSREKDHRILFSGGATLPHDFKGLDAEGKPAVISPVTFAFDLHGNRWETINDDTQDPRADTRGIVATPVGEMIIGGMLANAAFTAQAELVVKK